MPQITCYGAVGEIGGNKILLEDGNVRLLLDFGIAFGRQQAFFNEFLHPRASRGLLDSLAVGLIPPLRGLYREDLTPPGLWDRFGRSPLYRDLRRSDDKLAVDGLLLTHAHLDHNGDLSHLTREIPVHCTRVSAFIARAMQVTGMAGFDRETVFINPRVLSSGGDLVTTKESPQLVRRHVFLDGSLSVGACDLWGRPPSRKELHLYPTETITGRVAGLPVRWWPVDHSIPGAAAFAVQTSAGWVAYTGDIRFHGKNGAQTLRMAQELAQLHPVALLCEGTHTGAGPHLTEQNVIENALRLIRRAPKGLVIADFGPRNIERLFSFLALAARTGRILAVQPKDIYLLDAISLADPATFPDPLTLAGLALYADPKLAPRVWESELRTRWKSRTVSAADVSRDPGAFILCFSLFDANDLLDLVLHQGGVYLYSNSRAYDEEQAADLERVRNWVRLIGLALCGDPDDAGAVALHSSGHAGGPELAEFVKQVRPQALIPIHTEDPAWWQGQLAGTGVAVRQPEIGIAIKV